MMAVAQSAGTAHIRHARAEARPAVPYCDGGFQIGDVTAPVPAPDGTLYYRGARIVRAAMAAFLANATVGLAAATDVVISGCSAGGVSTFIHADAWAAALPAARVRVPTPPAIPPPHTTRQRVPDAAVPSRSAAASCRMLEPRPSPPPPSPAP